MVKMLRGLLLLGALPMLMWASGCGDDGCPGVVCTNCATDCDITCGPGETNVCIEHPDDPSLRCEYCE